MFAHHLLGILTFMGCLFSGYGNTGISCLLISVEFSTLFLNYRACYQKDQVKEFIP